MEGTPIVHEKMKVFDNVKSIFSKKMDLKPSVNKEHLKNISEKADSLLNKNWFYFLLLIPIMILGWFIRTQNLKILQWKYLIELDSYYFFRYAQDILQNGHLMAHDAMRYVPVGYSPGLPDTFFAYFLAYSGKFASLFGLTQIEWHVIYPPVITLISFIFFFLFVKEIFGNKIAILATAFLAVIPAYIFRTGAGFADHESFAMLLMFVSLWMFALAWKNKDNLKKSIIFSSVSAVFAGAMSLAWGGYTFLVIPVALFVIASIFMLNLSKNDIIQMSAWILVFLPINIYGRSINIYNLILIFALVSLLLFFILRQYIKLPEKLTDGLPIPLLTILASGLIGFILVSALKLINIKDVLTQVIHPTGFNRVAFTVSENIQPYFLGGSGIWSLIGYIFLFAFIGSIILCYVIFRSERDNKLANSISITFTAIYTLFLSALIFGRFSDQAKFAKMSAFFSNTFYFIAALLIALAIGYLYFYNKDKHVFEQIFKTHWNLLFILIMFSFTAIIARGAARTVFGFVPIVSILAAFFIVKVSEKTSQMDGWKWAPILLLVIALIAIGVTAQQSYLTNSHSGSGLEDGDWLAAYDFVKTNTSENAVFAHWWDYGYWTQSLGERASVVDGGNLMGWDHAMGRYGLTSDNLDETFSYYKTHNVTHLLLSSEEIGKYHAFATIGSDENFDRKTTIGTFQLADQKEVRNGTLVTYQGGWGFDKDYVLGNKVLSEGSAYLIGFTLNRENGTITNPTAYIYSKDGQSSVNISCVYQGGEKIEFTNNTEKLNGCLVLIPAITPQGKVDPAGGAFWVSEKAMNGLFARLYLYGEKVDGFKEVYSGNKPLMLYGYNLIGPIKIWEIEYPEGTQADPKYLESSPYG